MHLILARCVYCSPSSSRLQRRPEDKCTLIEWAQYEMSLEISMKLCRNRTGTTRMGTSGASTTTSLTRMVLYERSCETEVPSALRQSSTFVLFFWFGDANFGLAVYPQPPPTGTYGFGSGLKCLAHPIHAALYCAIISHRLSRLSLAATLSHHVHCSFNFKTMFSGLRDPPLSKSCFSCENHHLQSPISNNLSSRVE
ncbi:hypothetical protein BDN70DRAFT_490137 [Pholiota conissans]|uniref:Uncharacterized protein n=1 Tax=Pholiota conissans TaxID=109636 RepID=A0A9P5YRE0_9AGAR|nr:hypothetical protein BDN70DRAFT_490137 [Pholiota conissans]